MPYLQVKLSKSSYLDLKNMKPGNKSDKDPASTMQSTQAALVLAAPNFGTLQPDICKPSI